MPQKPSIALIGCGKMGRAMLRGWIASDIAHAITVLEPAGLPDEFKNTTLIRAVTTAADLPPADVFILAVKPQIMNEVCQSLKDNTSKDTLILSIAAGQKIGNFEKHFGPNQPVIRVMPNTPAAIGQGISVAVANGNVSPVQKTIAGTLLDSIGLVEWINDENLMDAVTALSGSGPAYVFHLMEVMAKAGVQSGLDSDFAMKLARQTIIGSAALTAAEPDTKAEQLRKNVTSPGGTTAAALDILMNGEMQDIFNRALAAATARSKELSQ
ncbi:MAG: pyrroline-5-carboxylate reductase [Micavibrio sp.]